MTTPEYAYYSHQYSLVEKCLLWSIFTIAFYGFLSASEFTSTTTTATNSLTCEDTEFSSSSIIIHLHQSKIDRFRKGCAITIAATNTSTCPCKALQLYSNLIPSAKKQGPVFNVGSFSPLTLERLTAVIRQLLHQAGISPHMYASHSFRIGAATTAAAAGFSAWLIKRLGQWNSNGFEQYIHTPSSIMNSASLLATTIITP